jgi:hypothetical protein
VTFFGYIETSQHNELTSRKAHPVQDSENAMDFVLTDNNAGRKYGVAIDRSIDRSIYVPGSIDEQQPFDSADVGIYGI